MVFPHIVHSYYPLVRSGAFRLRKILVLILIQATVPVFSSRVSVFVDRHVMLGRPCILRFSRRDGHLLELVLRGQVSLPVNFSQVRIDCQSEWCLFCSYCL